MLRVPNLKPDEVPFDPDFYKDINPLQDESDHSLATGRNSKHALSSESGAILMAVKHHPSPDTATANSDREREQHFISLLDHALVKDAVTKLHHEGDAQMVKFEHYDGLSICDIVKDQRQFIRDQRNAYKRQFSNGEQWRLFEAMTKEYFDQALIAAERLRDKKILEFQHDVVERQNEAFIKRALEPDAVFNDALQQRYRDMILFNLENTLMHLPEKTRKTRLDAASMAFYRKILDARLESDPTRLRTMLDAPAIRRVLGDDTLAEYEEKASLAIGFESMRHEAKHCVDEGVDPDEAKEKAREKYAEEEVDTFITYYNYWCYNKNRRNLLTRIINIGKAWQTVLDGGLHPGAIPTWIQRGDHELHAFLLREIRTRETNGGLSPAPEYACLLWFFENYEPYAAAEKLCDDNELFSLIHKLGGPDSEAFQMVLRTLLGKKTRGDQARLSDLSLARQELGRRADAGIPKKSVQEYLHSCDTVRRIRLEREEAEELDELVMRDVIEKCGAVFRKEG